MEHSLGREEEGGGGRLDNKGKDRKFQIMAQNTSGLITNDFCKSSTWSASLCSISFTCVRIPSTITVYFLTWPCVAYPITEPNSSPVDIAKGMDQNQGC